MLTLVGGPTSLALESFHSELEDDQMVPAGMNDAAAQQPVLRLTFRDDRGSVQHTTVLSTHRWHLGPAQSEARGQRLWDATAEFYASMGCELLNLEVVTTHPFSF